MTGSKNSRKGIKASNLKRSPAPKNIGNSSKTGCRICNYKLVNKIINKQTIVNDLQSIKKELKISNSSFDYS